jgi:hypothetical protein
MIALLQIIIQILPRCHLHESQQFYQTKMVNGFKFEPLEGMDSQLRFLEVSLGYQGLEK